MFVSLYIHKHTNIIKESTRENIELNFKSFEHFLPKDSFISSKRLDQLYALTTNIRKNLEKKKINDSSLNMFLSKENINLQKIEKDISDLQNIVQTKYELPTYQTTSFIKHDKFFNGDPYSQSMEHQKKLLNSNLSIKCSNLGNNTCNSLILCYLDSDESFLKINIDKPSTRKGSINQTPRKQIKNNTSYGNISSFGRK